MSFSSAILFVFFLLDTFVSCANGRASRQSYNMLKIVSKVSLNTALQKNMIEAFDIYVVDFLEIREDVCGWKFDLELL